MRIHHKHPRVTYEKKTIWNNYSAQYLQRAILVFWVDFSRDKSLKIGNRAEKDECERKWRPELSTGTSGKIYWASRRVNVSCVCLSTLQHDKEHTRGHLTTIYLSTRNQCRAKSTEIFSNIWTVKRSERNQSATFELIAGGSYNLIRGAFIAWRQLRHPFISDENNSVRVQIKRVWRCCRWDALIKLFLVTCA